MTATDRNRPIGAPRTKGNVLNSAVVFVRDVHASHWDRTLERLQPATREVVTGIVVASAWYPLEVFHDFAAALCDVIPGGATAVAREWGAWTIERDFRGGVYRVFMRVSSPTFLVKTFGRLWGLYHDHGRASVMSEGRDRARILLHGLHRPSLPMVHATIRAGGRLVELAGARRVNDSILAGGGPDDRFCEWEMDWRG